MKDPKRLIVSILSVCLTALCIHAEEKHPFSVEDDAALRSARAIAITADGETILYSVTFGGPKGPTNKEWYLIAADGTNARKLALRDKFAPLGFMKDGAAIYGTLEVEHKRQLAIVPLATGKPTIIIALESSVSSVAISPNGTRFALLSDPRPPDPLAETRTVIGNDMIGLYVVNSDGSGGGWWCPELTFIDEISWSPDGSSIAALSQTPKIGHHDVRCFIDLCTPSGARRVAEIPNAASGIAWTAGGKELVFISTTSQVITPDHVWTVPVGGGTPEDRTPGLSGTAMLLRGDPRGTVWVFVTRGVQVQIDALQNGTLKTVHRWPAGIFTGLPVFSPFSCARERYAFNVEDPEHAENVAIAREGGLEKITRAGDERLSRVALGPVRVVDWTAKDGTKLQGIVTFPAGYEEGRRYPFLVLPHGGPEGNDWLSLDSFSRIIAGLGYVVLQPQYRGSRGYGTEFMNAIYQHFGDRAYSDVDSATDYAIAQGWADPDRLAIFGWSAGGFMTAWTVTQTGRYRAAIEGAGITDWLSFIPTSDVMQTDYDRRLQEEDARPLLKFSAVMFANKVTTPLLILHGTNDWRVPVLQAREFFVLLAERGKTVRMVTYPGPHFPVLWEQRRVVFEETAAWLAQYNR